MAGSPQIVPRVGVAARTRRSSAAPPRYAKSVAFAVVHHTAGSNDYTRGQSRRRSSAAIELYHVRGNGWNDIGYNFLVDKYGQVFEGRAGGIDRNVIGAHAEGFNTGSVGVALIGNYSATVDRPAAEHALVGLLAWRLDVAHVDPLGIADVDVRRQPEVPARNAGEAARDLGSPRHRLHDLSRARASTRSCRHRAGRSRRPACRSSTRPSVTGGLGGPVGFTARLSRRRSVDGDRPGRLAAARSRAARGRAGGRLDVELRGCPIAASYTWTIEAGPTTRPAQGTIGKALAAASTAGRVASRRADASLRR